MTKEELEKEAEKFLGGWLIDPEIVKLLVDFAEPREEKIKSLGERCLQLQKDKGNLIDRVAELEQQIEKGKVVEHFEAYGQCRDSRRIADLEVQIEKMKQCGNCGNGTIGNCEHCKRKPKQKSTDTDDYWRLKEIKEK